MCRQPGSMGAGGDGGDDYDDERKKLGERYCEPKSGDADDGREDDESGDHEDDAPQHHIGDGPGGPFATLVVTDEGDIEGKRERAQAEQW